MDISFEEPIACCDVDISSQFVLNTKNVTINRIEWLHNGTVLDEYFEFVEGETYRIHVVVNTQGEYIFTDDPTVTFNGTTMGTITSRSDDYINYYADYVAVNPTIIDSVNVKVTKPVAGSGPKSPCSFTKNVNVTSYAWYEGENGTEPLAPDSYTFEAGKTYKLRFTVGTSSYRYEFSDATTISLIGLDPGKVVSAYPHSITYEVWLTATEEPTEYTITVTDGKATVGEGTEITEAAEGTTVTLTANKAPDGKVFDKWEVVSGSITLADATSETTTFTMPAGAVSVKATYKAAPHTPTPTPTPTPKPAPHTPTMPKSIKSGGVTYTKNSAGEYVGKKAKKPSIKKLKKGKKAFKITWKKVSGVSGYQVQYSTSKKFTKKTSKKITYKGNKKFTKTVKKLKGGKKYYVRVRTYKTVKVNGKTVKLYSSWSKAKTVTTKK